MSTPLAIDLYCGLGGWTEGLLAEGYYVVGFDNERQDYGDGKRYPAQLVLQDVLTLHGRQFKDAALIVASPPCQEYSYMAMPWSRAKAIVAEYRSSKRDVKKLTALFDACFRIQREACEAAGHHIPLVVENVRGAQKWVGRARWNFGSFYLWGDVPALMPMTKQRKMSGRNMSGNPKTRWGPHHVSPSSDEFAAIVGIKNNGGSWFGNYAEMRDGVKQGGDWFNADQPSISRMCNSKSKARKAASAAIAKIPFALAVHIARVWKPA